MSPFDLLLHLLNFIAPALVVGTLLPLLAWLVGPRSRGWLAQAALNSLAGAAVLATGLWFFGRDGKMATYAALVVVCATSQWLQTLRR